MTTITINLTNADDGWVASVAEMPGCITQGNDLHDVLDMVEDAMRGWADIAVEDGTANDAAKVVDAETKQQYVYRIAPKPQIAQYRYHAVFQGYTTDRRPLIAAAEITVREPIMEEWQIDSITNQSKKEFGETRVCTNLQLLAIEKNGKWVPA